MVEDDIGDPSVGGGHFLSSRSSEASSPLGLTIIRNDSCDGLSRFSCSFIFFGECNILRYNVTLNMAYVLFVADK